MVYIWPIDIPEVSTVNTSSTSWIESCYGEKCVNPKDPLDRNDWGGFPHPCDVKTFAFKNKETGEVLKYINYGGCEI